MTTMKNCSLCFNEFEEESIPRYPPNPKLPELCRKYFYQFLTREALLSDSISQSLPFCPKCFLTVIELYYLNDQLELYQKRIAGVVFIHSQEILHRLGNLSNSSSDQNNDTIKIDVSDLTNFVQTWDIPDDTIVTPTEDNSPEDIFDEDFKDPLFVTSSAVNCVNVDTVAFENIKVENDAFGLIEEEEWYERNGAEDIDVNFVIENTKLSEQNSGFSTSDTENKMNPVVKLRKLNFYDSNQKVILIENEQDNSGAQNKKNKLQTVWTKGDFGGSYKITAVNKIQASDNNCHENLESFENAFISTAASDFIAISSSDGQLSQVEASVISTDERVSKVTFCCFQCSQTFQTAQKLEVHGIIHSKEQPSNCNLKKQQQKHLNLLDNC